MLTSLRGLRRTLVVTIAACFATAFGGGCGSGTSASAPPSSPGTPGSSDSGTDAGAAATDGGDAIAEGGTGPTGRFVHPGILVNQGQLDFVKAKIAANADSWKTAFDKASANAAASAAYTPHPIAVVECGPFSMPNIGCNDEISDATAAYTQALLWVYTGEAHYAAKSIEIMNAWSAILQNHTNSNAPLQAAWAAELFPRAAEIVRYTSTAWAPADVAKFSAMLRTAYLPLIVNGSTFNGNWELSMIDAMLNIAVFNDDTATFDQAIAMWRKRVPEYIYLTTDGPLPVAEPSVSGKDAIIAYWQGQTTFVDGLTQETCRDSGHTGMGLASTINAAETALIQGVDLYSSESKRIVAGVEFYALYMNGAAVPMWLCGGAIKPGGSTRPFGEIAYNAYANRLGAPMPNLGAYLPTIRPTGTLLQMAWETLTHSQIGKAGMP